MPNTAIDEIAKVFTFDGNGAFEKWRSGFDSVGEAAERMSQNLEVARNEGRLSQVEWQRLIVRLNEYVDQAHEAIDPEKTVYQVVSGGSEFVRVGGKEINARAYLARFNFSGGDQEKLCGVLSGGERNRLHLALTLKAGANVLLLDEPTNDIDVNTLRALEEGLENFAGCAVVISHDRWFLDRICTHILAFEGNSEVFYFEGSYSDYEENKKARMGNVEPKRVRYRKL